METTRIGNIELRVYNEDNSGEIVRYFPNPYYGDEKRSTCKLKEMCCTIAYVEGCNGDEPDIKTVGSRPFLASDKDINDFIDVCRVVYKKYWEACDINNEEK